MQLQQSKQTWTVFEQAILDTCKRSPGTGPSTKQTRHLNTCPTFHAALQTSPSPCCCSYAFLFIMLIFFGCFCAAVMSWLQMINSSAPLQYADLYQRWRQHPTCVRSLQLLMKFKEFLFRGFRDLGMHLWLRNKPGYTQMCPLIQHLCPISAPTPHPISGFPKEFAF